MELQLDVSVLPQVSSCVSLPFQHSGRKRGDMGNEGLGSAHNVSSAYTFVPLPGG